MARKESALPFGADVELPPDIADDVRDSHFVPAPCQVACPIGTDAPSYLAYIWEEKFEEAFEAITATNPFSSVCGRVCDAPCEPACRRADSDGALAIRNLKRFVMERLGKDYHLPPVPVTKSKTVGIVGSGPAGLTAAQDLAEAGYEVHVYEMSDRPGGMMIWGIPAFRLPPHVLKEDIERMLRHCPGIKLHLNTGLGNQITLDELKERHDAVLLSIGSWWGKKMKIPGDERPAVVDGVTFLRRVNGGERPEIPETVVVVGGGDVAMDACRVAKRLPGCKTVKVIYRRGPEQIPARRDELKGAVAEGIEFVYHTLQQAVVEHGNGIALRCVKTELSEPGPDGRRLFREIAGSEHDVPCGMVIAAVGQQAESEELDGRGLMNVDRVRTDFETMRTADPKVFAAGDGAFGGSTIVIAMYQGHRAAYYVKAYLEGIEDPLSYKTPFRTRRVPVAQDLWWEKFPRQEQEFFGLGKNPVAFPEIEATYALETARDEAARCFRCDSETGSADYSVSSREDIFAMARTNPKDHKKKLDMLRKRLPTRENPFPAERPATLDDIVFLPANLSRLVIDPYREACKVSTTIGRGRIELAHPFIVTGFDDAPEEVRRGVAKGLAEGKAGYLGINPIGADVPWYQLVIPGQTEPRREAAALVYALGHQFRPVKAERLREHQALGLAISSSAAVKEAVPFALKNGFDLLLLDGSGGLGSPWAELRGAPDLTVLRNAIQRLRQLDREEDIDIVYFGGVRSGTDSAKLIGLGANAVVLGVTVGLAAGGVIAGNRGLEFDSSYGEDDRARSIQNILKASAAEASMMARATGKTDLHNVEPEDLRSLTITTAFATSLPIVGKHKPLPADFEVKPARLR